MNVSVTHESRRISNKIVSLVLLLELISIAIWGTFTYQGSKDELIKSISNELAETANRSQTEIGGFFSPIVHFADFLSGARYSMGLDDEEVTRLLYLFLSQRPEVKEISLVGEDGRELVRLSQIESFGPSELRQLSTYEVQDALRGLAKMGPISFSRYFEPEMTYAIPLGGLAGQAKVVLYATVSLKWLWDVLQNQSFGESGYVYIVDENFQLIAHHDPSLVRSRLRIPRDVPDELFADDESTVLHIYRSFDGQEVAGISRFDAHNRWWIVAEQRVAERLAPVHRVIQRFIMAFVLAVLVTIALVVMFSRLALRPLAALEKCFARVAAGEEGVQFDAPRSSDLGFLAQTFNAMVRGLDQRVRALADSEAKYRKLIETASDGIVIADGKSMRIVNANQKAQQLLERPAVSLIGDSIFALCVPEQRARWEMTLTVGLRGDRRIESQEFELRRGAERLSVELSASTAEVAGKPIVQVIFRDVTERKTHTAVLRYQATHDALTGLPNRQFLYLRMTRDLPRPRENRMCALLLIDLDRFKEVNDTLGHKSGDQLLRKIRGRLKPLLRSCDVLARLGGDEFALFMKNIPSSRDARRIAQLVVDVIKQPFNLDGLRVQIGASVGIALSPEHGIDAGTLMRRADIAMYHAKRETGGAALYEAELDSFSRDRLSLLAELNDAITDNQLVIYYQPKVNINDGKIVSVEALVRWCHPQHGLVMPSEFIPLAELGEHIHRISAWLLDKALAQRARWRRAGFNFSVAVNMSARDLHDTQFVARVKAMLDRHQLGGSDLHIEITESAIMVDLVRVRRAIDELTQLGVEVSIDDFGTGYSSLAHLKNLKVRELKIDKSFVIDMVRQTNDEAIVRSTIDLAHHLKMRVVAEGVESQELWERLRAVGCDAAQGYYTCRPLPVKELEQWIWRERHVAVS